MYQIGEMSRRLGVSADTLRYYEKIGLLPRVHRKSSGTRLYHEKDIFRMKFIRRSQKMGFSLDEIKQLIGFREAPGKANPEVRQLARKKLLEIEDHLNELTILQHEFQLLITRCRDDKDCCPILEALDDEKA